MSQDSEAVGAEVRDLGAFEPRPDAFHGIELGRIGGQSVRSERGVLGVEVVGRFTTSVGVKTVPQKHDRPADVSAEVP